MKLVLLDKETKSFINEFRADFVPAEGEVMIVYDNKPDETHYRVEKILRPTLYHEGHKHYRLLVGRP
jgi:hypothetical protein